MTQVKVLDQFLVLIIYSRIVGYYYYCDLNSIEFHHVLHKQQGEDSLALCHSQQNSATHDHTVLFRAESWELMNVECGENL